MKRLRYSLLIFMFILLGCEETIILDIDQAPTRVVIEAVLTNRLKDQYVRVSRTADFYSTGTPEKVSNARVKVTSNDGEEFEYAQISAGLYIPKIPFEGEIGKTYTLSVTVDNIVYTSTDELLRVAPIDSLGYRPFQGFDPNQDTEEDVYELLLYFKEPRETKDYYLFKFYRNDSLVYNTPNDIYVTSDEALAESINGFPSPVTYSLSDTARLEMFSLSRYGYIYYTDLTNLLFSDGGLFGPVPANPRSNFNNGALGFFQVSAVTTSTYILKE
ncbi:MAG: DUF4249 domain-containing protein [Cyclobacteriaceae bacterium]|jgi:hypothetical protein|nr:DUF4249 domain-containing protein [Cyclobacteriaceae bacterium]